MYLIKSIIIKLDYHSIQLLNQSEFYFLGIVAALTFTLLLFFREDFFSFSTEPVSCICFLCFVYLTI